MGIFEAVMLFCFGASWPLAIYKTYKSKNPVGKSLPFLYLILIGYASGICHKVFVSYNWVIFLYIINLLMVGIDILLTRHYCYKKFEPDMKEQHDRVLKETKKLGFGRYFFPRNKANVYIKGKYD